MVVPEGRLLSPPGAQARLSHWRVVSGQHPEGALRTLQGTCFPVVALPVPSRGLFTSAVVGTGGVMWGPQHHFPDEDVAAG